MTNAVKLGSLVAAVAVSGAGIWLASGYTREPPPVPPPPPGMTVSADSVSLSPDAPQWKSLTLSPVEAASAHLSDPFPARVKIDETLASKIGSPLAGHVTGVFVELGQKVKLGQPLFAVASAEIANLRAERAKALVALETSKMKLTQTRAMVADKAMAGKEEMLATQEERQAEVDLRLAQEKLISLRVAARDDHQFDVIAPRDGIVVEKNVLPGQAISSEGAGDVPIVIADLDDVWVVADLFENDAVGISEGTPAKISSPALPELAIDTTVQMVSAVVDPARHTIAVRVRVPNPELALKPNIYAEMRFLVPPRRGAVEIPATTLVSDGAKQYVYRQTTAGTLVRTPIVAASAREGKVDVLDGLTVKDVVVSEGAILLDNQIQLTE